MTSSRTLAVIVAACVFAAAFTFGCDPKFSTGPGAGTGTGTGTGDDPVTVPEEARLVGNIIALHMDLIQASFAKSADFDGGFSGHTERSIFTESCITYEPDVAGWDVFLDGCVDSDGTTYRGGGLLIPIEGADGYYFWPHGDPSQMIIASNLDDVTLNHTSGQGNIQFHYQRSSGNVTGMAISNWVIHRVADENVSLTYELEYSGGIGSHGTHPLGGGTIQLSGNYMTPPFEISFGGGSVATFTHREIPMQINLDTGAVTLANN